MKIFCQIFWQENFYKTDKDNSQKKKKEKIETNKVVSDKVSLPLSAETPIKSWFDIVSQDQSKVDSSKALEIQQWIELISRTPELLKAIQVTIKPPASEQPSVLGLPPSSIASQLISKSEKGESSSSSKILSQSILNPVNTQKSSQIILSQSKVKASEFLAKTTFQNILTVEDSFYHKDPFFCLQNHFPKN